MYLRSQVYKRDWRASPICQIGSNLLAEDERNTNQNGQKSLISIKKEIQHQDVRINVFQILLDTKLLNKLWWNTWVLKWVLLNLVSPRVSYIHGSEEIFTKDIIEGIGRLSECWFNRCSKKKRQRRCNKHWILNFFTIPSLILTL